MLVITLYETKTEQFCYKNVFIAPNYFHYRFMKDFILNENNGYSCNTMEFSLVIMSILVNKNKII